MNCFAQVLTLIQDEAEQSSLKDIAGHVHSLKDIKSFDNLNEDRIELFLNLMNECLKQKNSKLKMAGQNGYETIIRQREFWESKFKHSLMTIILTAIDNVIHHVQEHQQIELLKRLMELSTNQVAFMHLDHLSLITEISASLISISDSDKSLKMTGATATSIHVHQVYLKNLLVNNQALEDNCQKICDEQLVSILQNLHLQLQDLHVQNHQISKDKSNLSTAIQVSNIIVLYLKVIQSILSSFETAEIISEKSQEFIKKHLGPLFLKLLSCGDNQAAKTRETWSRSKKIKKRISSMRRRKDHFVPLEWKIKQTKEIYNLVYQLVRLFGWTLKMRTLLVALLQRILLQPLVYFRSNSLHFVKEMFKSPEMIVKLSSTVTEDNQIIYEGENSSLMKIIFDSLVECSYTNDEEILCEVVDCVATLVHSIDSLVRCEIQLNTTLKRIIGAKRNDPNRSAVSFGTFEDDFESCIDEESEVAEAREVAVEKMDPSLEEGDFELSSYKTKLMEILKGTEDSDDSMAAVASDGDNLSEEVFTPDEMESPRKESAKKESPNKNLPNTKQDFQRGENIPTFYGLENCENSSKSRDSLDFSKNCEAFNLRERENAKKLVENLEQFVPRLLEMNTTAEIDMALQTFASDFCKDVWMQQNGMVPDGLIVNGDGIYLTTFSALLLTLKLVETGFYSAEGKLSPCVTDDEFVNQVHKAGLLTYVSTTWLLQVYQQIVSRNVLACLQDQLSSNIRFLEMLRDIGDFGTDFSGFSGQEVFSSMSTASSGEETVKDICLHISKQVLDGFWGPIINIFGSIFKNSSELSALKSSPFAILLSSNFSYKELSERNSLNIKREAIVRSLSALQCAARLCISLGLSSKCHRVFDLLSRSVIADQSRECMDNQNHFNQVDNGLAIRKPEKIQLLHASQIMSLRSILMDGLEIASQCESCWDYVVRCCAFIDDFELNYYACKQTQPLCKRLSRYFKMKSSNSEKGQQEDANKEPLSIQASLPNFSSIADICTFLNQVIEEEISPKEGQKCDGILKGSALEKCMESLSLLVDFLFSEATSRLKLTSLLALLEVLIARSGEDLLENDRKSPESSAVTFSRFCEVLIHVAKSNRPLMHVMKCWGVSSPHLTVVASSSKTDRRTFKSAISSINDIIAAVLINHSELDFFNFNEALFIPFERIMLLELGDVKFQEIVMNSICGFVEGYRGEIKSGWRPLFGALRSVQLPQPICNGTLGREEGVGRVRELRLMLDIFEAFLRNDHLKVFANAALDCLLCLLQLLKGSCQSGSHDLGFTGSNDQEIDLCLLSLKYIHQFELMLQTINRMASCPPFRFSRKIRTTQEPKTVEFSDEWKNDLPSEFYTPPITLSELDKPSKIYSVWFILIDGLFDSIVRCPAKWQSKTMEICITILGTLASSADVQFAGYCINHVALPFLQEWAFEIKSERLPCTLNNFKHFFGLISHLVTQHLKLQQDGQTIKGSDLMLSQMLFIIYQSSVDLRHSSCYHLSLSCLSHVEIELRDRLSESQSLVVAECHKLIHTSSLAKLRTLVDCFPSKSLDFHENLERIRVTTRNRPSDLGVARELAQDMFLLDIQRVCPSKSSQESDEATCDQLSNQNLVIELTQDGKKIEVYLDDLVQDLIKHQILMGILAKSFLKSLYFSLPQIFPIIDNKLFNSGFTVSLSRDILERVLQMTQQSYSLFYEFDARPGLKLIIQKLFKLPSLANLYRHSALSFCIAFCIAVNNYIENESSDRSWFADKITTLFETLCEHYSQSVVLNLKSLNLDSLVSNPIHLFPESLASSEKHGAPKTSDHLSPRGLAESGREWPENEETEKRYILMDEKKIQDVMKDYKKWKSQHSPLPSSFSADGRRPEGQKHGLTSEGKREEENGTENRELVKDFEAYESLFTQIFIAVLKYIMSFEENRFNTVIPLLNTGIEKLIIHGRSQELRSILSLLYRRCCRIAIR